MKRVINELTKIINDKINVMLDSQNTVIVYKIFAFISIIIEKSSANKLKKLLIENYQEEFK
jgi:hypothetical protein